ncbi:hypothetical protein [Gordonibacter urolithinfaciens]|uniref:hypothetical protein n=1 Tax=Gordonibacter urolithinfaciens TaxID=1335613 RepID=UPI003A9349DF
MGGGREKLVMTHVPDRPAPTSLVSEGDSVLVDTLRLSVSKHKVDEHFTLVWANRYYYDFIGYPKDEYEALFHNRPDLYFADNPEGFAVIAEHVTEALEKNTGGYECIAGLNVKGGP